MKEKKRGEMKVCEKVKRKVMDIVVRGQLMGETPPMIIVSLMPPPLIVHQKIVILQMTIEFLNVHLMPFWHEGFLLRFGVEFEALLFNFPKHYNYGKEDF